MQLFKDGKALENLFNENDRKSQEILPALIDRLVKASCNKNTETHFPRGSAVFTPGVDGITTNVDCYCKYVPKGKSIWEFGTQEKPVSKIEDDYQKRKNSTKIKNKSKKNYVAVTSRIIDSSKKLTMMENYSNERVFKKVHILDANDLVEWLDENIEISIWLLKQFDRRVDEYEIKLLTDEWDFITSVTKPNLPFSLFLCGNEARAKQFIEDLKQHDDISFSFSSKYYERDAAYFFIVSALMDNADESIIDRCMVVKSQSALYLVNSMCENKIVVVDCSIESNFSVPLKNNVYIFFDNPLYSAVALDMSDKNRFVSILKELKIESKDADNYSFLTNHNPVALRRLLSNIPSIKVPQWANDKEKYKMIPLMLLGEIDMDSKIYTKILELLFGDDYDSFLFSLNYLSELKSPPVYKYGHVYRSGCRFECFNYVSVDVYLKIVARVEQVLNKLIFEPNSFGNSNHIDRVIFDIIQGFIIITEKNQNNQLHFDYYVDSVLSDIVGDIDKTNLIKGYLFALTELSPVALLRYLRKTIDSEKDYLIGFCKEERKIQFGKPSENVAYLLSSLKYCLSNPEYAFEALEHLLNLYFEINSSKETEQAVKDYLSPIASMTGMTAIPFLNKAKYFFDYIKNKKIDISKAEPIVRMFHTDGVSSISTSSGGTYRKDNSRSYTCTYKDIFDAHDMAFEWLMVNSKDRESHIEEMFHNIHHNPFKQMEKEFRLVIDNVNDIPEDQRNRIRISAISTKGNILRFTSWHTLLEYIPLLDELIKALEPKELFDKYRYVLTNDFFPLENPPLEGDLEYEKEEKSRSTKRRDVVKELIDVYGQEVIERIMIECGDESYYIWQEIQKVSADQFRDIDNMVKHRCEKGLRCYLSNSNFATIKLVFNKYSEEDIVLKTLPFTSDIIRLIGGSKKESVFWSNNFFYREKGVGFGEVFDKFLEFYPFGIIAEMAYHQDVEYNQGLSLLNKIADLISIGKESDNIKKNIYEIQELVERMDVKYYSSELSLCEFKLLPILMGGLRDYPLGVKKYFWANPIAFADLLVSLVNNKELIKDGTIGSKIYFNALLTLGDSCFIPKEYLVQQKEKINDWVSKMLSKCDFANNEEASHLIINAIIGTLSACPKMPGQGLWPIIEIADVLEKIGSLQGLNGHEISSSFAIAVLNRRGIRTITNGDAEFILSETYLANGYAYENTHPVTYTAIKIISNDIKTGAERDRASYDLDVF